VVADRDEYLLLLGHLEAGTQQRLEVRLVHVRAEAGHPAGRGHLHAQARVGDVKARERELRRLDAHVVDVDARVQDVIDAMGLRSCANANDVPRGLDAKKMQIAYWLLALLSLRYIS
jgi:hypothetical protein